MSPNEKQSEWLEQAHARAAAKQTHASFPQLKYPSLRDKGFKDPAQWLQGKSLDDGAEGLWRVHDKLYELSDFVGRHPGGEEWLMLTKGTDVTEAFETHHLNPSVAAFLETFYVRPAATPRNSPFTFHPDGFYKTLKLKVVEELKTIPKHVSRYSNLITDGLFVTMVVCSAASCWDFDPWLVNGFYLVAALSMALLTVAAHNYVHRRDNWRMYLFNASLLSYRDFRVSHALSHHLYTNTLMDLEISMYEPLFPWNPRRGKGLYARLAVLVQLLMFPTFFLMRFLKKLTLMFTGERLWLRHFRWHDFLGFALPAWMWLASGCGLAHALYTWFWIITTASLCFHVIGLTGAHHHPDIFHDGDQTETTPDWGMHELEAVMDRTDISGNLFKVLTFFGDHALHHLFPTLDHATLSYLYPVFLEHCEQFRANFRMTSSLDMMLGQIKQLARTEFKVLKD